MKICFVASEAFPYAKVGGLADVSLGLTRFLGREGHDVRLFLPLYSTILKQDAELEPVDSLRDVPIPIGRGSVSCTVFATRLPKSDVRLYLVHAPVFYDRAGIYTNDADEHLRFAFFSRATIECCQRLGWSPDIYHCNDWHTALAPVYLKGPYAWDALFRHTKTVLTLHNLGYQGVFPAHVLSEIGLAEHAHLLDPDDLRAGRLGFLKSGLRTADAITTVSPTYAREIQTPEHGFGLHDLLRARHASLHGILNGVDYEEWSPEHDVHIPHRYSADTLALKEKNKEALLAELSLSYDPSVPVVGIVSRLAYQKGFDVLFDTLPAWLTTQDVRLVALGQGERRYEEFFGALSRTLASKVAYRRTHEDRLAHLIEAGSDLFVMPSRYEPCGLNQMYSLRYGTVPVVRRTGGLADTVTPFDPATGRGTGFVFDDLKGRALLAALELAIEAFRDAASWERIRRNGMAEDFSWAKQGRRYLDVYTRLAAG